MHIYVWHHLCVVFGLDGKHVLATVQDCFVLHSEGASFYPSVSPASGVHACPCAQDPPSRPAALPANISFTPRRSASPAAWSPYDIWAGASNVAVRNNTVHTVAGTPRMHRCAVVPHLLMAATSHVALLDLEHVMQLSGMAVDYTSPHATRVQSGPT